MKKNPLQFALEFEQKGALMYLELAAQTENPLGKKLFYSLAVEEVDHARQIDLLSAQLKDLSGMGVLDTPSLPPVTEVIKTFFTTADKTSLKGNVSNVTAYEHAMKMEREGYAAYKDFAATAATSAERTFFQHLMEQEQGHLDAIANVYAYLTGTGDWLQGDESHTWNWMNI